MFQQSKKSNIGLSITPKVIEAAVFSPKTNAIVDAVSIETPIGSLDANGDLIRDPKILKEAIQLVLKQLKAKVDAVNLTIPGTLFRMVDMPKMAPEQLYVSLSSEAERYRTFDNTDAVVDFTVVENDSLNIPANKMNVVFSAVRQDTLELYSAILKALKIKIASISIEPVDILRGMAGTGVLDSLVEQIGVNDFWGSIFVEPERVRISLWQGSQLFEFRETHINTADFSTVTVDSLTVADMVEEIRRTSKIGTPRIWLTYQMPSNMQSILSELLMIPVRDCNLGSALALSNPNLQLSTIGAALQSVIPFPFSLNLAKSLSPSSGKISGAAADLSDKGGNGSDSSSAIIGFGAVAACLALVISAVLWIGGTVIEGQANALQTEYDQKQTSLNALTAEKTELAAKVSIYQKLKASLDEARIRNRIYVMLTDDLQKQKPKRLWVQDIHVGGGETGEYTGKIALEGKAHDHQDIMYYARRFDHAPYLKAFSIEQIKEQRLMGLPVFNYKIQGDIFLNPSLTPSSNANVQVPTDTQPNTP